MNPLDVLKKDVNEKLIAGIGEFGRINVKWQGRKRADTDASSAQLEGFYGCFYDWESAFEGRKKVSAYKVRLPITQVSTLFDKVDEDDVREVLIVDGDKPVAVYLGVQMLLHFEFLRSVKKDPVFRARMRRSMAEAKAGKFVTLDKFVEVVEALLGKAKTKTVSMTELRRHFFRIVLEVEEKRIVFIVTRRGKPMVRIEPI